jgi:hypothetical protein
MSARPARYGHPVMRAPAAPAAAHPAACAAARLGLLAALLLLATACSAGPGPAGTTSAGTPQTGHAAFLAAVDVVCARAVSAHAGHPFPLPVFDPEHPRPGQLPTVGNYFARYGGLPQTVTALRRLTPPAADAVTWRHLLDVAGQMASNAQHQIAAAGARNVTAFVQTVRTANRLAAEINAAGARFGFTPNSACSQVFG